MCNVKGANHNDEPTDISAVPLSSAKHFNMICQLTVLVLQLTNLLLSSMSLF